MLSGVADTSGPVGLNRDQARNTHRLALGLGAEQATVMTKIIRRAPTKPENVAPRKT